jgi:hypothetical protein
MIAGDNVKKGKRIGIVVVTRDTDDGKKCLVSWLLGARLPSEGVRRSRRTWVKERYLERID